MTRGRAEGCVGSRATRREWRCGCDAWRKARASSIDTWPLCASARTHSGAEAAGAAERCGCVDAALLLPAAAIRLAHLLTRHLTPVPAFCRARRRSATRFRREPRTPRSASATHAHCSLMGDDPAVVLLGEQAQHQGTWGYSATPLRPGPPRRDRPRRTVRAVRRVDPRSRFACTVVDRTRRSGERRPSDFGRRGQADHRIFGSSANVFVPAYAITMIAQNSPPPSHHGFGTARRTEIAPRTTTGISFEVGGAVTWSAGAPPSKYRPTALPATRRGKRAAWPVQQRMARTPRR